MAGMDVLPEGVEREEREAEGEFVEHTSFSRLDTYNRCGFKYMFKYEMGIRAPQNMNMMRGKAAHKALELNARHKIETGNDMPFEQIADLFGTMFDQALPETELGVRDNPDAERDNTIRTLAEWRDKYAASITPLAVEVEFLMPLPEREGAEPVPPILGFIDEIRQENRVVITNGQPTQRKSAIDHKFPSKKPSNAIDRAIMSPQLTIYDWALTEAGTPPDDIGFQFFIPPTKTLPGRIETAYRPINLMTPAARAARHARTEFMLRRIYRAIRRGDTYLPKDDPTICSTCEYRNMCQYSLVKDDYIAEKLTAESFKI